MTLRVSLMTGAMAVGAFVALGTGTAWAQDEQELGWSETAELTVVATGGNAEASTLGIRNELARAWETANLAIDIGALRAESSTATRTAIGASPASFQVTKDSTSALTAESYFARGRYDRKISARTFWYGGTGWERNTFAGIENRYSWGGGLGNTWVDDDRMTFKTAYGVSYTVQDDVVETTGGSDSFAGLQVSYDFSRQLTSNAGFTSVLVADENLNETADFRTDFTNAVTVSMSGQLALKVSWQMLYDRQPSLVGLPLIGFDGLPTGDTVFDELAGIDNFVTFALVASF